MKKAIIILLVFSMAMAMNHPLPKAARRYPRLKTRIRAQSRRRPSRKQRQKLSSRTGKQRAAMRIRKAHHLQAARLTPS